MNGIAQGTALVTGASSGIGRVYAERLADRGYDLLLVARDEKRLSELASDIGKETGRKAEVFTADLANAEQLDRVTIRLREDRAINLLVNNAGTSLTPEGIYGNNDATLRQMLALNTVATTLLAAAAAQTFPDRTNAGIINIGSVMAFMPERFDGVYSGTKAFILNLTLALNAQLAGKVRVQAVIPGATRTEIWERSGKDIKAFNPEIVMEAEDLVDGALAGYDQGEAVTIPSLAEAAHWDAFQKSRAAMAPHLNNRRLASRYTVAAGVQS